MSSPKSGSLLAWLQSAVLKMQQSQSQSSFMLLEACFIGAAAALAAVVFGNGVSHLTESRNLLCKIYPSYLVLPLLGLAGGTICGVFVKYIAPEISGSGIPQVKAFLKGYPMKLDMRVAFAKLVSGIVALGVGLPLGREGPTVQVGAAAASISGRVGYQSPKHRRQLIAAGAGAGLAAAFNAPLAGVMFIIEELSRQVSSKTVSPALLACFFAGIVSRYMGNHSLDISPTSMFPRAMFYPSNLPFCILLGLVCGVIGAAFNESVIKSIKIQDHVYGKHIVLRVAIAGLICGIVAALLPPDMRDFAGVRDLIFENKRWFYPIMAVLANFTLAALAYGSGAPGGLFAPSLIIGAGVGGILGLAEVHWLGWSQSPITLELAGMGALFASVARVPLTAIIVVFEMTADFNLLLPLMISSIVSFTVAEKLSPGGLYDRLLELKGVHLEEEKDEQDEAEIVRAKIAQAETRESGTGEC